ncbi:DMT family transporter [Deinococcus roseus]|uniref:EamA domain-containing protein n=1 Tax=Deinococcus roseus TaxID=392414 RepID=A0ABQ2DBJ0_9DEIO|nr:DMT family transporter [Deinococcus roseus]GGJ52696.1 hypothetical protein GCM10008938_43310 [Deinococcus roseus]
MNTALAGLLSALTYGTADFLAGLASRHDPALRVIALTHPLAALFLLALALSLGQPIPALESLLWGAGAGLMGLLALLAFLQALAIGPMGAVSVTAGALSALVPVGVGLVQGETLSLLGWVGAACVLLGTLWLTLSPHGQHAEKHSSGMLLGILAGLGFGFFFVLLGQVQDSSGNLWTLAAARISSSLVALPLTLWTVGLQPRNLKLILASAPGDTLGNLFYLLAVQGGGLALSGLLTSLYPAVTTMLAVLVLREHLRGRQWAGMIVALTGAALLATS